MRALGAYIFAGGFTAGVRRHFDVIGHLEGSDYGVSTARLNYPDLPIRYPKSAWHARELVGDEPLDFLYCNPPCAIFSCMGIATTRGVGAWRNDPRTECWYDSFGLAEELRPRAWAIESVTQAYGTGRELMDELTKRGLAAGYSITHLLIDARWMGLPQSRRRSFDVTQRDRDLIDQIVNRVLELRSDDVAAPSRARLMFRMDLTACHANGTPLDLEKLLSTGDFTLVRDVVGIARHLDRTTGKLTGHFLPRCAALPTGTAVLEGAPA